MLEAVCPSPRLTTFESQIWGLRGRGLDSAVHDELIVESSALSLHASVTSPPSHDSHRLKNAQKHPRDQSSTELREGASLSSCGAILFSSGPRLQTTTTAAAAQNNNNSKYAGDSNGPCPCSALPSSDKRSHQTEMKRKLVSSQHVTICTAESAKLAWPLCAQFYQWQH